MDFSHYSVPINFGAAVHLATLMEFRLFKNDMFFPHNEKKAEAEEIFVRFQKMGMSIDALLPFAFRRTRQT